MAEFHFFVRDRFFGTGERPLLYNVGTLHKARNLLFICPRCGAQWAAIVTPEEGHIFQAVHKVCEPCGGTGSLLTFGHDQSLFQGFPRDVLIREMDIAAKYWPRRWPHDFKH